MDYNTEVLLNFHAEAQQIQRTSILGGLLQGRLKEFYKLNGIKIDTAYGKIRKLQEEYCIFKDGKIEHAIAPDDRGNKVPLIQEGKTLEEFNAKVASLLSEPQNINF